MKDIIGTTIVAVPVVNELTQDGIVTLLELEEIVFLGMTWGAWFKVGMGIALLLLIIERALSIRIKLKQGD